MAFDVFSLELDFLAEEFGYFSRNVSMRVIPTLFCKDGFNLSVQASSNHYCFPRKNLPTLNDYVSVEIGYPSESISDFVVVPPDSTDSIYGWVKIEQLKAIIDFHGGFSHFQISYGAEKGKNIYLTDLTDFTALLYD